MINKIKAIRDYLCSMYVEREEVINGLMTALVAKQHVLLVGTPGTAKSAIIADLARCVTGIEHFEWLLTKFSTPEELFGPISLKALSEDVYKRNTKGKLPEAHIAFLDEIFKANSAILNSLLTLVNERLFHNNGSAVASPLSSLIGASNEWPQEDEGLEALFDRFVLRYEIESIADGQNFLSMLKSEYHVERPKISLDELASWQMHCEMVNIPDDIYDVLLEIRDRLKNEGVKPSDRRFRQSLSLLMASATIDGRTEVIRRDLLILSNSFWVNPEKAEINIVNDIIKDVALDPIEKQVDALKTTVRDLIDQIEMLDTNDRNKAIEMTSKVGKVLKELKELPQENEDVISMSQLMEKKQKELIEANLGI